MFCFATQMQQDRKSRYNMPDVCYTIPTILGFYLLVNRFLWILQFEDLEIKSNRYDVYINNNIYCFVCLFVNTEKNVVWVYINNKKGVKYLHLNIIQSYEVFKDVFVLKIKLYRNTLIHFVENEEQQNSNEKYIRTHVFPSISTWVFPKKKKTYGDETLVKTLKGPTDNRTIRCLCKNKFYYNLLQQITETSNSLIVTKIPLVYTPNNLCLCDSYYLSSKLFDFYEHSAISTP